MSTEREYAGRLPPFGRSPRGEALPPASRAPGPPRPAPPAHGVYRGFRYEKKKRMKPQPADTSDVDKLGDLKWTYSLKKNTYIYPQYDNRV